MKGTDFIMGDFFRKQYDNEVQDNTVIISMYSAEEIEKIMDIQLFHIC